MRVRLTHMAAAFAMFAGLAQAETRPAPAQLSAVLTPISVQDADQVRAAIEKCWNTGTLPTDSLAVKVAVRVKVGRDRKPITASMRLTGYAGGNEAQAQQVYASARRAVIRCGKDGLPLPADTYDTWKDLELVFDPSGLRLR